MLTQKQRARLEEMVAGVIQNLQDNLAETLSAPTVLPSPTGEGLEISGQQCAGAGVGDPGGAARGLGVGGRALLLSL